MRYEIDQSGKIEDTSKDTIPAISNDTDFCLLIPRHVKRSLQKMFRYYGYTRIFVLVVFSAGLSLLLQKGSPQKRVVIDIEYYGKEEIILGYLNDMLPDIHSLHISFLRVGKSSPAHFLANTTATGRKKPNYKADLEGILAEIKKTGVLKTTKGRLSQG